MKVTIAEQPTFIERVSKTTGRAYKLWTLKDVEGTEFRDIFGGPFEVGQEVELTQDPQGGWKVTGKSETQRRAGGGKSFKADPEKLAQDKLLAVATNLSIQRQVAMKGAVDLIVAGKREYADLTDTFDDLMELLNRRAAQVKDSAEEPF